MKTKYKVIQLMCHDLLSFDKWESIDEIPSELFKLHVLGYLVKETKDAFLISHTIGVDNTSCCILTIPKTSVIKYKFIKSLTLEIKD